MVEKESFRIEKCKNCYRVTRTDVNSNLHTHIKSLRLCELVINAVCKEKIPLHLSKRCLISAQRLSTNKYYIAKIDKVLHAKKSKEKKAKLCESKYKTKGLRINV